MAGVQFNTPDLPGDERWELDDVIGLRQRVESYGLRLEAIENIPNPFYDKAMFGQAGRDRQIDNVAATVRNLGRAGVPVLGFHWMPTSVLAHGPEPGRPGRAVVSAFDLAASQGAGARDKVLIARRDRRVEDQKDSWSRGALFEVPIELNDQDMWSNYEYFVNALVPVATEQGYAWPCTPTTLRSPN